MTKNTKFNSQPSSWVLHLGT